VRILFIKPKHIGDSLILTPTIAATKRKHPQAEIWVVVRRGCEGILAGCPQIDRVLAVSEVEKHERSAGSFLHEVKVRASLLSQPFDYIFELGDGHRARGLVLFCRGKKFSVKTATPLSPWWRKRFDGVSTFDWEACHRVEKDYYTVSEFLPLGEPVPSLVFNRARTSRWPGAESLAAFAMMHVGCRQRINRWHAEGWTEVGRHLLTRFPHLVLTSGRDKEETDVALAVQQTLGGRVICTLGQTTWPEMADLLYRTRVFVTPNTAAMHLAAACQAPTVALFGPSLEDHWRPWQSPHQIVIKRGFERLPGPAGFRDIKEQRSTLEIASADVIEACEKMAKIPRTPTAA
jgi:heptosyltransferase III